MSGVGWLVYDRTGSALALGLVGLAAFLPALLLALIAGAVADRFDRRLHRHRRAGPSSRWAKLALLYCAVTPGPPGLADLRLHRARRHVPCVRQPRDAGPAAEPACRGVLPSGGLVQRVGMAELVDRGPGRRRLSLCASARPPCSATSTFCFAIGVAARSPPSRCAAQAAGRASGRRWQTLFAGVSFIRSRPVVLGAISLDLFAVLLGGAVALLPIYAQGHPAGRARGGSACCAACPPPGPSA